MIPTHVTSISQLPGDLPTVVDELLTECRAHRAEAGTGIVASRKFSWYEGPRIYDADVVLRGYEDGDGTMPTLTASFRVREEDDRRNELAGELFELAAEAIGQLPGATNFRHDPDGWTRVELPLEL